MAEVVFASLFSFKIFRVVDRALKKHFNFDAEETVMQLFQRPILTKDGKDLIESAKKGDLPTPFGRQNEIDDVAYILARSKRNNPCLIGERGVGKKTIVHGLAKLIADGGARKCIAGKKVIYVDLKLLDSDEKMRVNKFKRLMKEGKKRKDTILFIGEVHDLLGVGADAVKLLGQALAGNDLQCIATSTPSEFKKHKLDQYFAAMEVDEVTVDTTVQILKGLHQDFQNRLELQLSDGVFVAAATLAHRHISDGLLPQKEICLINKVGSKRSMRREADTIKEEDLRRFLKLDTVFTGHPIEEYLHKRVIGQDDGVGAVTRAVHRATLGLNDPNKPIASFVFCGTTGVGKTELAKALASFLFGSDAACLELDITKVMHSQSFACELTDAVRWHQKAVILLKDFENANPDIENMMLKIVQHGMLTGKKGLVYDFRKSALIMTCSIAQTVVEKGDADKSMKDLVNQEVKKKINPKLINSIDDVIFFKRPTKPEARMIAEMKLTEALKKFTNRGIQVEVTQKLKEHIVKEACKPSFEASRLRRAIVRVLDDTVAVRMLSGEFKKHQSAVVDIDVRGVNITVPGEEHSV